MGKYDPACCSCGDAPSVTHGLPTYNGDIVSNDFPLPTNASPACEACHLLHERDLLVTHDESYDHLFGFTLGDGI